MGKKSDSVRLAASVAERLFMLAGRFNAQNTINRWAASRSDRSIPEVFRIVVDPVPF